MTKPTGEKRNTKTRSRKSQKKSAKVLPFPTPKPFLLKQVLAQTALAVAATGAANAELTLFVCTLGLDVALLTERVQRLEQAQKETKP